MTRYRVHVEDDMIHAESEAEARAEFIQALIKDGARRCRRWYGWPWYSRLRLGTRRQRVEVWLLRKRYDLAVRLVGRERAKPFDYLPF